jgi:hypothetical protein
MYDDSTRVRWATLESTNKMWVFSGINRAFYSKPGFYPFFFDRMRYNMIMATHELVCIEQTLLFESSFSNNKGIHALSV